jgi:hypothetical protein
MSEHTDPGLPPLTNRGVVRPDDRLSGGVDYLKLTVWGPIEEVRQALEWGILDQYGWGVDQYSIQEDWIEKAAGGRVENIYDAGCLQLIQHKDEAIRGDEYCTVEVKGRGCEFLGNEGIRYLFDDLGDKFKIRASRVDVMAHTDYFTPRTISDAVLAGDYSSRSVKPENRVYIESDAGDTCYLGMGSKPSGGLRRIGECALRIYDRRGTTRIELQTSGGHAHGAGGLLSMRPVEEWPGMIRGFMRHYCDFVDRAANVRVCRCPLLDWWNAFIENHEKISTNTSKDTLESTPLGKIDGTLNRYARNLYAAIEAYGADWIIKRIERHGRIKKNEDHANLVEELVRFRGSGLAGVPDRDEDIPI